MTTRQQPNQLSKLLLTVITSTFALGGAANVFADIATSTVAVGGYDAVGYQTDGKAIRGSGDYVTVFEGETYLFSNQQNKQTFEANPQRFVPAYGGYCAYGVAKGKKFVGDPEIWKVVRGRLYLNLNSKIQVQWNKDVRGNIAKAEVHWAQIWDKAPADL